MRQIVYELTFVSFAIFEEDLTETLHPSSSKFSLIFYPICASPQQFTLALIVIVSPLSLIDDVAICIDQLPFSFHLTFNPIPKVVAAIIIDVFASTMSQSISLFAFISVSICIDLASFYIWSILRYQSASQPLTCSSIIERIENFAKTIRVEL